jgi:hypothetical protein
VVFKARVFFVAVFAALWTAGVGAANAQIMRRPEVRPIQNRVGLGIGLVQNFGVVDGSTGSTWDFGSGLEYAARIERPTRSGGLAFGAQASYARLPLRYSSTAFTGEANATVQQLMALVRYGGGYSFHSVYELAVGAVGFSNFRSSEGASTKLSNSTDYDPKLSIGYGFGFGLSPRSSIEVIQEFGIVLHQREGLAASESNYPRIFVTRLGGKMSF